MCGVLCAFRRFLASETELFFKDDEGVYLNSEAIKISTIVDYSKAEVIF
jgi:hypothetical protein